MRRALMVLFSLVAAAACYTGPSAGKFRAATTPHGVDSSIELRQTIVRGELLEVRDTAYVVLDHSGLILVPFAAIRHAKFEGVASHGSGGPSAAISQIRLLSRYPHGIPPAVFDALLSEVHQTELRLVSQ